MEKKFRTKKQMILCYVYLILLYNSVTVYHSSDMENLQHLPCYLMKINQSPNMGKTVYSVMLKSPALEARS